MRAPVAAMGCPRLQPEPETRNPYYGASMLRCGAVAETLAAGSAPGHEE